MSDERVCGMATSELEEYLRVMETPRFVAGYAEIRGLGLSDAEERRRLQALFAEVADARRVLAL